MNKYFKKIVLSVLAFCMVSPLSFVNAMKRRGALLDDMHYCCYQFLPIQVDSYRYYADQHGKPRTLIIGSGRGVLRFGDEVYAEKYDEYAYGDKKFDYFLVDACRGLKPDYLCDATDQGSTDLLGVGTWDKCILEFLPHSVSMNGALKNAVKLVKPGGKVYMNATNFFDKGYDSPYVDIPERCRQFRRGFASFLGLTTGPDKPNFCELLTEYPGELEYFFQNAYALSSDEVTIKLVPVSDETWPSRNRSEGFTHIWEITKR